MVKTFKDIMHVDTHCRYVFMYPASKYLEKNSVFFLIYKMPEKGHQSAPEEEELMQLTTVALTVSE